MLPAETDFPRIFLRNTLPNYLRIIAGMFAAVFFSFSAENSVGKFPADLKTAANNYLRRF
jgi:hypothetical protein